jgi:DNA-directed RNA polymerase specialized sigma24 family protein
MFIIIMMNVGPLGGATMNFDNLGGVSEKEGNFNIQEILVRFEPYIVMLVHKRVCNSSNIARPEVLDLEIDEIIQRVRIKFWQALLKKEIEHHKAYLRTIVSNEFNDIGRRRKAPLPLQMDEDGELYMGNVLVNEGNEFADPAFLFEKEEELENLLEVTAQVVPDLPPRMELAMINHLKDQVDNLILLTMMFEKYKVTINSKQWPDDPVDTKRLKASLSPARQRIAQRIGLNLSEYKKLGTQGDLRLLMNQDEKKECS